MAGRPALAGEARSVLPAPAVLAAVALAGFAAVLVLPEVASSLPRGDEPEPNATQLAVTATGLLALTAAGLYVAARRTSLGTTWLALAFAYNAAIVVVKFILSPAAFDRTPGTELTGYLAVGLAVMLLYGAALVAIYLLARRGRSSWAAKAALVVGLLLFAMVSRFVAAVVLGEAASDYLDHVFSGAGLWLPVLIVAASVAAVAAFDRATDLGAALGIGLGLVVVYHALWVPFMLRLF